MVIYYLSSGLSLLNARETERPCSQQIISLSSDKFTAEINDNVISYRQAVTHGVQMIDLTKGVN